MDLKNQLNQAKIIQIEYDLDNTSHKTLDLQYKCKSIYK